MITDTGLDEVLNRFAGISANGTLYAAVGSGTTAPTVCDTALQTEIDRVAIIVKSITSGVLTLKAFFPTNSGNGIIAEVGLIDSAAAGILIYHSAETPSQTKTSTQEMIVEYAISLARA